MCSETIIFFQNTGKNCSFLQRRVNKTVQQNGYQALGQITIYPLTTKEVTDEFGHNLHLFTVDNTHFIAKKTPDIRYNSEHSNSPVPFLQQTIKQFSHKIINIVIFLLI
ncbi:hypothetical protein [Photorhabdus temperata]|uniref:hypothetical protein n=1 Tax=Photorhabdus temperata TaxID=574560 RepID=UPI000389FC67|nr:hypothetical protein [Photorhabdus temperata]EQB98357.1 hypothetical protein B738_25280 [Photorhabdus temperata subsp. temperata M1021]